MEFDYLEDAEGIAESFGVSPEELATMSLQVMKFSYENKIKKSTATLMAMIESGEITGGQILALATMSLVITQKQATVHFLKTLVEEEEI